jgi:hypothetical protein
MYYSAMTALRMKWVWNPLMGMVGWLEYFVMKTSPKADTTSWFCVGDIFLFRSLSGRYTSPTWFEKSKRFYICWRAICCWGLSCHSGVLRSSLTRLWYTAGIADKLKCLQCAISTPPIKFIIQLCPNRSVLGAAMKELMTSLPAVTNLLVNWLV